MTFFFLDSILFSIWHTALPVCQDLSGDILLLNRYFSNDPTAGVICKLRFVGLVVTRILHVPESIVPNIFVGFFDI